MNGVTEEIVEEKYTGHIYNIMGHTIFFKSNSGFEFSSTSNALHHQKKMRRYLSTVGFPIDLLGCFGTDILNKMVDRYSGSYTEITVICNVDKYGDEVDVQRFNNFKMI